MISLLKRLYLFVMRGRHYGVSFFRNLRYSAADRLLPTVSVTVPGGHAIKYRGYSAKSALRGLNSLAKEPKTQDWVSKFDADSIFWDVGANVGIFSLLAAKTRSARVLAFEPFPQTYHNLLENIAVNGLNQRISGFNFALADKTGMDWLYLRNITPGFSGNSFGAPLDQYGGTYEFADKVAIAGFTIDHLVDECGFPPPNYLKIDVDGIEPKILEGARRTLSHPALRSVLVELEGSVSGHVETSVAIMEAAGFVVAYKFKTTDKETATTYNFVFERRQNG